MALLSCRPNGVSELADPPNFTYFFAQRGPSTSMDSGRDQSSYRGRTSTPHGKHFVRRFRLFRIFTKFQVDRYRPFICLYFTLWTNDRT
ncbi:hypothetical protein Y032_0017g3353 [Ancylostoma ceylanicum]|uniref:Uncharacterized protein n=1 Tax=Ancylostoma ceylanicum TaxID=53326 RepID=A0A016V6T7_9BILA|nr:hypothetical protein Y032_0017g3353 [Ancylostoma ceylanicum]